MDLLLDDIQNHLSSLPVKARPSTIGYRTSKFISRHRWGVITTAAVVLVLISLTGFYTMRLSSERRRAEAEARTNARVSDFLVDLFASADPYQARGERLSAREILDRGASRIESQLAGDPAIQARLLATMAQAYKNLEAWDSGLELSDAALSLQEHIPGDRAEDRAELLWMQGGILTSLACYPEARERLGEALEASITAHGPQHEEIVFIKNALAIVEELDGNHEDAEARYNEALVLALTLPGAPESLAVADVRNLLGRLYGRLGRREDAIAQLAECVRIRELLMDENAVEKAACLNLLGAAYMEKGDFDTAEPYLIASLEINRHALGEISRGTAFAQSNLASLYKYRGEPARAKPLLVAAAETQRTRVGDQHPDYGTSLNNLANVHQDLGEIDEAVKLQRQSLAVARAAFGDDNVEVATNLSNLASKLEELGDFEEAETMYRETLAMDRKLLGDRHPYVALDRASLASLLLITGRFEESETLLREALILQEGNPDISPVSLAATLTTLGKLMMKSPRLVDAEPVLRRAVTMREESLAADSVPLAEVRNLLGGCLLQQGRTDEARMLLEESYPVLKSKRRPENRDLLGATARMVDLYTSVGETDRAAELQAELTAAGWK